MSVRPKPWTDHLGKQYNSFDKMCEEYHISPQTVKYRLRHGYTLGVALLNSVRLTSTPYEDHLGNHYDTIQDMCKAYGVKPTTFSNRKARGWSLEACLSAPWGTETSGKEVEYQGKHYKSIAALCRDFDVNYQTFMSRRRNGYTIEECLSQKNRDGKKCKDHLGREFTSIKDMCEAHGVQYETYYARKYRGHSLEECLQPTKLRRKNRHRMKKCVDHLGNHYPSKTEMAKAYGISVIYFLQRMHRGWSLEKTLTTPVRPRK